MIEDNQEYNEIVIAFKEVNGEIQIFGKWFAEHPKLKEKAIEFIKLVKAEEKVKE